MLGQLRFTREQSSHTGPQKPVRVCVVHGQVCFYPIDPMTDSHHIPTTISEQGLWCWEVGMSCLSGKVWDHLAL